LHERIARRPARGCPGLAVEPAPARAAPDTKPRKAPAPSPAEAQEEELDDDAAWLASLPAVEADPEREAERRRALMRVEPAAVRRTIGHAPLRGIEQYLVAGDPVAYEEWFARQPKPPRRVMEFLGEEDAAAVRWVTRNNPPWIRGRYLGYYRPPVPARLFAPGAAGEDEDQAPPPRPAFLPAPPAEAGAGAAAPAPARPVAELRARLARLLDRGRPRLAEELDLAEAVCALKWPNRPAYKGPVDPFLLRVPAAPGAGGRGHRHRRPALAGQHRAGAAMPGGRGGGQAGPGLLTRAAAPSPARLAATSACSVSSSGNRLSWRRATM